MIGVEPAGLGIDTNHHGAPLKHGRLGIFFRDEVPPDAESDGQVEESYSVSAGLDFPSVGPQHAHLNAIGRARYEAISMMKPWRLLNHWRNMKVSFPPLNQRMP